MVAREAWPGPATAVLLGFAVLPLIPRNFCEICFNNVSELSEQQNRDISLCLNLSAVCICMGTEVP